MSFTTPTDGQPAIAEHVAQLTETLKGNRSIPITLSSTLTFTGTSPRILAPLSTSPNSTRLLFENSAADSASYLGVKPSGTGIGSALLSYEISDTANSPYGILWDDGTQVVIGSGASGGGTPKGLSIWSSGEKWKIPTTGHLLAGADNTYDIGASGATRPRDVYVANRVVAPAVGTIDTTTFSLRVTNTNRWQITSSGHFLAAVDNTYDIGASGATRPRDLFLGRNLATGSNAGIGVVAAAQKMLTVQGTLSTLTTGILSQPTFGSDSAGLTGFGVDASLVTAATAFTLGTYAAYRANAPFLGAGSSLTTAYGLQVINQGAAGITNAYGVHIAAQSGASTLNVGLRNLGTSVLEGQVDIGNPVRGSIYGAAGSTPSFDVGSTTVRSSIFGADILSLSANARWDGTGWARNATGGVGLWEVDTVKAMLYFAPSAGAAVPPAWVSVFSVSSAGQVRGVDGGSFGAWVDFTPTLDQGGAVAKTVNFARWCRIGNTVFMRVAMNVTGAGVSGGIISVFLPGGVPTIKDIALENVCGTMLSYTNIGWCTGAAEARGAQMLAFFRGDQPAGGLFGSDPVIALVNGHQFNFQITYETADA